MKLLATLAVAGLDTEIYFFYKTRLGLQLAGTLLGV